MKILKAKWTRWQFVKNYIFRCFREFFITIAQKRCWVSDQSGVVFLAPHPTLRNPTDGFAQRVAYVDKLFCNFHRCYLSVTWRKPHGKSVQMRDDNSIIIIIYPGNLHLIPAVIGLVLNYGILYIHSVYSVSRLFDTILLFMASVHCIFDAHGIVPEEMRYESKPNVWRFALVERLVFQRAKTIIVVSRAMAQYLYQKYPSLNATCIILPIFCEASFNSEKPYSRLPNIVYAGGTQLWQLLPLMLQGIAAQRNNACYHILTPAPLNIPIDIEPFLRSHPNVHFASVSPSEVQLLYPKMHFGFLLRETHPINFVACPTKLLEYLANGIIPILNFHEIGDFAAYGLRFVPFKDFLNGNLPDSEDREEMVRDNFALYARLLATQEKGKAELTNLMNEIMR